MPKYREMYRPLIAWDAPDGTKHDGVVWSAKIRDRYLLEVRPTFTRCGMLVVFDHHKDDKEVVCWEVSVGLGPPHLEAARWLKKASEYVVTHYEKEA